MRGICPFAELIEGIEAQAAACLARVGFVDHIAAGFLSTMRRAGFWNEAGVSAHFAVGRDGTVVQLVNVFDTAWHAGKLGPAQTWAPYEEMKRETGSANPNGWLIGIEHEGFPEDVWPAAMIEADLRLKRWCVAETASAGYDLLRFGIDSLAGHFMFDGRNRAACPGPNWPRARLFAALRGDGCMVRFNRVSRWFDDGANQRFAGDREIDAAADFAGLPEEAVALEVAVYLQPGSPACEVFDGRSGAGSEEHYAFEVDGPYFQGRVNLGADRHFFLRARRGEVRLRRVGCVGYYTA